MSKYDKWYIIGKLLCSTFRICKKLQICKNWIFYRKIQLYSKNVCEKMNKFTFLKSLWPCHFKYAKNLQKICNFFCKTCAIGFLMSKPFQKAKFYQNLTSGSGSKQRFSLLQEKAVIQAVSLRTQAVSIKAWF